jgi:hypothetical protein
MSKQQWWCVGLLVVGAGCAPYVVKDNVVGPHGEQLVELSCGTPDACMSFARETCHGDFEVATNDLYAPTNQSMGGDIMMVHCANPPGGLPPPPVMVPPDAGH